MAKSIALGPNGDLLFKTGPNTWLKIMATADDTLSFQGAGGEVVTLVNTKHQTSYATKTANYTMTASDDVIGADSSGGVITITLPVASTVTGRKMRVFDKGGSAQTNNITIARQGSDTINGDTSVIINSNHDHVVFFSDGSNWFAQLA